MLQNAGSIKSCLPGHHSSSITLKFFLSKLFNFVPRLCVRCSYFTSFNKMFQNLRPLALRPLALRPGDANQRDGEGEEVILSVGDRENGLSRC